MIVMDIETQAAPEDGLLRVCPFDESNWSPESLTMDELRHVLEMTEREAPRSAKKADLVLMVTEWREASAAAKELARQMHLEKLRDRAALNAETLEVLAVGFLGPDGEVQVIDLHSHCENELVAIALGTAAAACDPLGKLHGQVVVGHNLLGFDLPVLVRRARILNVRVPLSLYTAEGAWVRWHHAFVDTMRLWQLGDRQCYISLDRLARAFGLSGKTGSGADFAALWKHDHAAAREYLSRDLELTYAVAQKLGVRDLAYASTEGGKEVAK